MSEVKITARGYYGSKIREPGDENFNLAARSDLGSWMEPVGWEPEADPLDHDGDGKKGGSLPADREGLKALATELGLEFPANIKTASLHNLIAAKKAETAAASDAGDGEISDDDKILKALEISGRSDEMTVTEAEAIIAASASGGADDI